jgi:hypothetical protein
MVDRSSAGRLALAHLRLVEGGDPVAAAGLLEGLGAAELRAVLTAQTGNLTLLFELVFAGQVGESRLPGLAAEHGRSRAEVVNDYLEALILRFALAEVKP